MANLTVETLGKEGEAWESVEDFRKRKGGISNNTILYAIERDMIDYIAVGQRAKAILLTEKSLAYSPNPNPKRG